MYQTNIKKGFDKQWTAKTYIQLAEPDRQLKVWTMKSTRGVLYTSVQAVKIEGNIESFLMFGDYRQTVMEFPEVKRVTDKIISECHNKSLNNIQKHIDAANEFYSKPVN